MNPNEPDPTTSAPGDGYRWIKAGEVFQPGDQYCGDDIWKDVLSLGYENQFRETFRRPVLAATVNQETK